MRSATVRRRSPVTRLAVTALLVTGALAGLTACGGGGASPSAATATAPPGDGSGFRARFAQIQQCLTAAGIGVPSFSPRPFPTGSRRPFPTDRPRPTARPTGRAGRGPFDQLLRDPKAQQALSACGITLPGSRP